MRGHYHAVLLVSFYRSTLPTSQRDLPPALQSYWFAPHLSSLMLGYVTLGLAIVLAVRVGGVIPVFAYLVVPAVSAILLVKTRSGVVVVGIIMAILGSVFGIYFSVSFDFPAGSSVVAVLGFIFLVSSAVRLLFVRLSNRFLSE